jgi:glycosyltransferase involved in cell wall biosynthesis
MLITVAVCTYNRAELLDRTLLEMGRLVIPAGVSWELLVIANNCRDQTPEVVRRHSEGLPIRALTEPRQGLSHARNCAIEAARGDLLLWTDDDVLVDPHWIAGYVRAAAQHPEATFFGGPVEPWFAVSPPTWLSANFALFSGAYAVRRAPEGMLGLHDETFLPFGANFGVRRDGLEATRFDTTLGRIGSELISGEEVQFLRELLARGHFGIWVEDAAVRHYIPADRINERYLRDYYFAKGQSRIRMTATDQRPSLRTLRLKGLKGRWKAWSSRSRVTGRWARGFKAAAMADGMVDELRRDKD